MKINVKKIFIKTLKISSIFLCLTVLFGFICSFTLPKVVKLDKFIPKIEKSIQDMSGFQVDIQGVRVKSGWKVYANKLSLKYPTGEKFAQMENVAIRIAPFPLLKKQIKIEKLYLENLIARLKVDKNGKFEIEKYLTNNNSSNFSTQLPATMVRNYSVAILNGNKTYALKGKELKITDFVLDKQIKIVTTGAAFLNGRKQITYDVNLNSTVFPKKNKQNSFTELFDNLYKLNLNSHIALHLKLSEKGDNYNADGILNIQNLSITTKGKQLPNSYVYLTFVGDKFKIDSDIYTDKDEKATISGFFTFGKNLNIDLKIKSLKTDLENSILIAKTLGNIFGNHSFDKISANGHLSADFTIKGSTKKINSQGYLNLDNVNAKYDIYRLNNVFADIDFSNNKINIKKSNANLNNSPINISGSIDPNLNLTITANKVPLNALVLLTKDYTQNNLIKNIHINNGLATINAKVTGKLDKITPQINVFLENVNVATKNTKTKFHSAEIVMNNNNKGYAQFNNINLFTQKADAITIAKLKLDLSDNTIILNPTNAFCRNSKINLEGKVTGLKEDNTLLNFTLDGFIPASEIADWTGNVFQSQGQIPFRTKLYGTPEVINITAQGLLNESNYIRFFELPEENTILNFNAKLFNNTLKINDLSLNKTSKHLSSDFSLKNINKIVNASGEITNINKIPTFKAFQFTTAEPITLVLPNFENSKAILDGDLLINGSTNAPLIIGNISIPEISIPNIQLILKNTRANFSRNDIRFSTEKAILKTDEYILSGTLRTNSNGAIDLSKGLIVDKLNLSGSNFDLATIKNINQNFVRTPALKLNQHNLTINSGNVSLQKAKTGIFETSNINSNLSIKNGIITLSNLKADAYNGKIAGEITYDIAKDILNMDIQGRGLSADATSRLITKATISGNADFDSKLTITDTSSFLQNITGNAKFIVHDGHAGMLGKLEHLLYAQNIVADKMTRTSLNVVIKAITAKNTGLFNYLRGELNFKDGIINSDLIQMGGLSMSLFAKGQYDMLNHSANLNIFGRLSNEVVSVLGAFGDLSLSKFMDISHKNGIVKYADEVTKLPPLTTQIEIPTKIFRAVINGPVEKQTSVKTFQWIMN